MHNMENNSNMIKKESQKQIAVNIKLDNLLGNKKHSVSSTPFLIKEEEN